MKECIVCKIEKQESEFSKNKTRKDGLQTTCKICAKLIFKEYYKENSEKHKETVRNKKNNKNTKICKVCNEEKSLIAFKTARMNLCIKCERIRNRIDERKYVNKKKDFIKLHKTFCIVCLEDDPDVLDFHHLKNKSFNIACAAELKLSYQLIIEEIQKCVLLCANCHRKYHRKRFCLLCDKE